MEIEYKQPKKVYQYKTNGALVDEYGSINDASRKTNIRVEKISQCANGHKQTAGGFIWRFERIIKNTKDLF